MTSFPIAKSLSESGEFVTKPTAAILRTGLSAPALKHDRILAIGESINTTFPLTGEGIGKAMETGVFAADELTNAIENQTSQPVYDFSDLVHKKLKKKYTGYHLAENWCNKTWFFDFIITQGKKSSKIREKMVDILEERIDFNALLTWRRITRFIIKSLLPTLKRS